MISCLKGEFLYKSPDKVTILVNGVGYEVFLSAASLEKL
ncbi:MAG: Holliday junction branch migration protein RuvA, partial [Deltaproteobacteria bacterium]|nr:Holliday junction branch migration protein RuvA [Deltaproteobacteria bacterium]